MSISFAPTPVPCSPALVIAGAREQLAGLHEVLWAARSPRELLDAVAEMERFKSEFAARLRDEIHDLKRELRQMVEAGAR